MIGKEWKLVVFKLTQLAGPLKGDTSAPRFMESYYESLGRCNFERLMAALDDVRDREKFYPVPGTILEYYRAQLVPPERQLPEAEMSEHARLRARLAKLYFFEYLYAGNEEEEQQLFARNGPAGRSAFEQYVEQHINQVDQMEQERRELIAQRRTIAGLNERAERLESVADIMKRIDLEEPTDAE